MIRAEPIGWLNTGLPLAVLGLLAVLLPLVLVPRETRSQMRLVWGLAASAVAILAIGAGVFSLLYAARGQQVGIAFSADPAGVAGFFLVRSAKTAVLWGPVLGLVWLGRAQAIEARKGRDMALADRASDANGQLAASRVGRPGERQTGGNG